MARHRSRSPIPSRSGSPSRGKRYDDPRERRHERRSPAPSGLLVRNISLSSRPEDLRAPFERFGPIKDVYLPKNYYTGEPRGFGFVKFRYPEDAADAKSQLDRAVIGGREIRIVFAEENRKTPQEMRKITHVSSRRSYRRRSPSLSPRRRHYCQLKLHFCSLRLSIDADCFNFQRYSSSMTISLWLITYHLLPVAAHSRSPSPARRDSRRHRARDDRYSPHQSRSLSRSVSPTDDRIPRSREKYPTRSRSLSRSVSPHEEKKHRPSHHSPSPRGNGRSNHAPSRSPSPRKNSKSPVRSRSRSRSPR